MMRSNTIPHLLIVCIISVSCAQQEADDSLKTAFDGSFYIGAALGNWIFLGENQSFRALVSQQFNSISPENMLKWGPFNPEPNVYNYSPVDRYVQYGVENNMFVVGHVLFWQNQTPEWVFEDSAGQLLSREVLLQRMAERVQLLVDRYGSSIHAWDVVNEAILDSGQLRESRWTQILASDYIEQGFRIADSLFSKDVELLYNDFNMTKEGKRNAVISMIGDFKAKGLRIDGVGMQGHWKLDEPSVESIEESILAFHGAGVDVHITELDIDVLPAVQGMFGDGNGEAIRDKYTANATNNPYEDGLPEEMQEKLAARYGELFDLFVRHSDKIKRVTFWGVTDKNSWLNNWPVRGRTNHPLLFDRVGNPKPAFCAVLEQVNGR